MNTFNNGKCAVRTCASEGKLAVPYLDLEQQKTVSLCLCAKHAREFLKQKKLAIKSYVKACERRGK